MNILQHVGWILDLYFDTSSEFRAMSTLFPRAELTQSPPVELEGDSLISLTI